MAITKKHVPIEIIHLDYVLTNAVLVGGKTGAALAPLIFIQLTPKFT